jgi:CheY-like chemotaxis protein
LIAMQEDPNVDRPGSLRILVADDSPDTLHALRHFLAGQGHEVVTAEDGSTACERCLEARPDLVLMDMVMPGMDGVEATRRMRAEVAAPWFPIVLLSSVHDVREAVHGLEAGADDFLPKPVNLRLLAAKIASFERIAAMQRALMSQAEALRRLQDEQALEEELAAVLIGNLVQQGGASDPSLRWRVLPSARFSGDVVAVARSPDGRLHVLLGDAAGHGLAASVSLIPALQVFYGMVRKGLPLVDLLREMNDRLHQQLPVDRYMAALMVVLDNSSGRMEFWNGGMPSGIVLSGQGEVVRELPSDHLPLGILPPNAFEPQCGVWEWGDGGQLVLHSDGLVEAENPEGEPFGLERLHRRIACGGGGDVVDSVITELQDHLGVRSARDDASIVAIRLGPVGALS